MSDVAGHAGVSRTSVSFVLNGRTDTSIPERTRARILAAADELGYRPNAGARALASRRSESFGLISEIVTEPYALDIIRGAQQRAWADNRFLLIAAGSDRGGGGPESPSARTRPAPRSTHRSPRAPHETAPADPGTADARTVPADTRTAPADELDAVAVEKLLEQRPGGLLYATASHRIVALPPAAYEVPTVLVHCRDAEGRLPSVLPDEEGGARTATRRLLEAGHRRVALLNLAATMPAAEGRRRGYEQALRAAESHLDPGLVVTAGTTADDGHRAARALLDTASAPTALFCANDRMAMGAYDAARELGLRIPDDLAIIGFDNQELIATGLRPRLTTVALPFHEMGVRGVELLTRLTATTAAPDTADAPAATAGRRPRDAPTDPRTGVRTTDTTVGAGTGRGPHPGTPAPVQLVLDCPLVERGSV